MVESIKNNSINNAYTEVYDIILHLDENLKKKIPSKFIEIIKENRNINYSVNIDYSKKIVEQNVLHDTKVILSVIYRDFLVDSETKIKLKNEDKLLTEKEYNYNDLFKSNKNEMKQTEVKEKVESVSLVQYKVNVFVRFWNRIISIFKRNQ